MVENMIIWTQSRGDIEKRIKVPVCNTAAVSNTNAEKLSRSVNDDVEWAVEQNRFDKLLRRHSSRHIDLFASKMSTKLTKYFESREVFIGV